MVADVTVVGAGLVALTSAIALADRGIPVRLVGTALRGEASEAAGGLLAPSAEPELRSISALATAARDMYPDYLAMLADRTGIAVPLNRDGILQVALSESDESSLRATIPNESRWLHQQELAQLEPELAHAMGAVYHPNDGAVDPLLLMDAVRTLAARHANITVANERVCEVRFTSTDCDVVTDAEGRYSASAIVLAAGAWSPIIEGLPSELPVRPLKGEMVAFRGTDVRHVIFAAGGYFIPKEDGHIIAGSTREDVGFDCTVTEAGVAKVRQTACEAIPSLCDAHVSATWAGLRPMAPDFLPIIGRDPQETRLVYACGHSRNGILLSPLTAEMVADIITENVPVHGADQFRPDRY